MAGVFRIGWRCAAPPREERLISCDAHWSLATLEPSAKVVAGAFCASDRSLVPYRLWQADRPRALVLLLHGAFDYSGSFDEIGPILTARGFTAFAYDQRGFGATASRGRWSSKKRLVKDAVESVALLRRRFGKLPVFILGESMGAAVAIHTAARGQRLDLAGIVLVAPGAVAGTFRRMFGIFLARLLKRLAPESEIVFERLSGWELTPGAAIRLLSDPLVLRAVRPPVAFGLLELAASAVDLAQKVSVPSLTMAGSKDDLLRTACIAQLHRGLRGAKSWRTFEGGPHLLLHWQHRDRVLETIFAFLDARVAASVAEAPKIRAQLSAQLLPL